MDIESYSKELTYFFLTDKEKFDKKVSSDVGFFKKACRIKHVSFNFDKKEVEKAESDVKIHLIRKNMNLLEILINRANEIHKLENLILEQGSRKNKVLHETLFKQWEKWLNYQRGLFKDPDFIEDTIDDRLEEFESTINFYKGSDSIFFRNIKKVKVTKERCKNAKDWQKLLPDNFYTDIKMSIGPIMDEINRHLDIFFTYLESSKHQSDREKVTRVLNQGLEVMINLSEELKNMVPEIEHTRALHEHFREIKKERSDNSLSIKSDKDKVDSNNGVTFHSFFKNIEKEQIRKIEIELKPILKNKQLAIFISLAYHHGILGLESNSKQGLSASRFVSLFNNNRRYQSVNKYLDSDFSFLGDPRDKISIKRQLEEILSIS